MQRTWKFVIFEEAQLMFPEGSFRGSKCNACVELVSVGRNFKLRFGAITPFSANVDKMLTKITQQRFFGWTCEKNDIRYLEGFIGKKAKDLKHLKAGGFIYHRPSKNILRKIRIEPHKRTVSLTQLAPLPQLSERPKETEEKVSQVMHKIAVVCAIAGFIFIVVSMLI